LKKLRIHLFFPITVIRLPIFNKLLEFIFPSEYKNVKHFRGKQSITLAGLEVSRLLKISCFLYTGFLHGERVWAAKKGYRPPKQKNEKGNKPTQIHLKPGSLRDFRAQIANSRTLKKGKNGNGCGAIHTRASRNQDLLLHRQDNTPDKWTSSLYVFDNQLDIVMTFRCFRRVL